MCDKLKKQCASYPCDRLFHGKTTTSHPNFKPDRLPLTTRCATQLLPPRTVCRYWPGGSGRRNAPWLWRGATLALAGRVPAGALRMRATFATAVSADDEGPFWPPRLGLFSRSGPDMPMPASAASGTGRAFNDPALFPMPE